tara:strand:+ start:477 stop:971 length:495 start_codon:yes stop_codon:yes gene_type:complete
MDNKLTSDKIINMLSLNEEIATLNYKIKQVVEDLHNTQQGLGSLQELTTELNGKISQLKTNASDYKPEKLTSDIMGTASYKVDGLVRERIAPGPEDYQELYVEATKEPSPPVKVAAVATPTPPAPTAIPKPPARPKPPATDAPKRRQPKKRSNKKSSFDKFSKK